MATSTPNLADQWRQLTPDQRNEAMSRMNDSQKQQLASALGYNANRPTGSVVKATPSLFSMPGIKEKLYTARDWVVNNLPQAGGLIGGLIGAGAGAETGPGLLGTAAAGAAAGGGLGETAKQAINEHLHPENKMTAYQAATGIGKQALSQGAQELGGQLAGRLVGRVARKVAPPEHVLAKYPVLKSVFAVNDEASPQAAQHLTAAAATKQNAGQALQHINNTMEDLEGEITKLPPEQRTVEGFQKAVNTRKDAMNAESGAAMMSPVNVNGENVPLRAAQSVPIGISDSIKNLVRDYMTQTPEGLANRKYILNKAAQFEKPWSYGQLDQLRTDLAAQMAKHNAKNPVAKYAAQKGDLDLAIDNSILNGLRDTVYPEMDKAAAKPAGYFEDLKGRQSSLIQLQEILDKRIKDLKGQQAVSEVTPAIGSENLSVSGHVGNLPRVGLYGLRQAIAPTRELAAADKHVAAAFPNINSAPYRLLFSGELRAAQLQPPPKSKKAQDIEQQMPEVTPWYAQQ